jgi:hypothetical protein
MLPHWLQQKLARNISNIKENGFIPVLDAFKRD